MKISKQLKVICESSEPSEKDRLMDYVKHKISQLKKPSSIKSETPDYRKGQLEAYQNMLEVIEDVPL